MARQAPPTQTPEGRRKARGRLVGGAVVLLTVSACAFMSLSTGGRAEGEAMTEHLALTLPSSIRHLHVPTYDEASRWAHHVMHPDHDDDDDDGRGSVLDGDENDNANLRGRGVGVGEEGESGGDGGGGGGERQDAPEPADGDGERGGDGGGDEGSNGGDDDSRGNQPPDLRVGPDGTLPADEAELKDYALVMAYKQSTSRARCMGAEPDMMPSFTKQAGLRKKRSENFPSRPGFVGVSHIEGIRKGTVRARTENGPRKAKHESTLNPKVSKAEEALVACLEDLSKCTHESRRAAWGLKGVRDARLGHILPGVKRHKRCAVVGNAGGMLLKEYGRLIDKHDAVIRINVLENSKYFANLGKETTYRVLSYKMSKDVCCIMPPNKHPPDNKHMSYLVWFPAMRKDIVQRIKYRYKQPVIEMKGGFLNSAVGGFKTMRDELVRIGFGPFEDWEYMTSGMHAILAFSRMCETLDVYGFTTDVNSGPYWFTGRKVAPQSGRRQHSWDHERMILRLLHAAGHLNICA